VKSRLDLSAKIYVCAVCDLSVDRDLNAAINLARWTPAVALATTST
jgi:transposase